MKFLLFACVLISSIQLIFALNEEQVDHSEHYKKCITPQLDGTFGGSTKIYDCPPGKPFGNEISISFENIDDYFSYKVTICRKKHKPQLPKKIFNCAVRRATKQCRSIGLPACVTDESLLYGRWEIVNDCLEKVLRKCSNGVVETH